MRLHEAWFKIAELIENRQEGWICNSANRLLRQGDISEASHRRIYARVQVERERQASEDGRLWLQMDRSSLWPDAMVYEDSGKIARLQFIASELRRLARRKR